MPDPITLLHNAARHYCIDRELLWRERYYTLVAEKGDQVLSQSGKHTWEYSDAARRIFPRYNLLAAILRDIEQFVPADFASLQQARDLLAAAGEVAASGSTQGTNNIEREAIADERREFAGFITCITPQECQRYPILPYRRVLTAQEYRKRMTDFAKVWGVWYGGTTKSPSLPPNATLHTAAMDNTPGSYDHLRQTLASHGVTRPFELSPERNSCELDLSDAPFSYRGAEAFWTDNSMSWMVYASHESSITFGGTWLIDAMKAYLPEYSRYLYKGWDLSQYGDGTT